MRIFKSIVIKFLAAFVVAFLVPAGVATWLHIDSNAASEREQLAARVGTKAARVAAALDRHAALGDEQLNRDLLTPLAMDADVLCADLSPAAGIGHRAGAELPCSRRARSAAQLHFPVDGGRMTLDVAFSDAAIHAAAQSRRDLLVAVLLLGLLTATSAALLGFRVTVGRRLARLNSAIHQIAAGGRRCPVPAMGDDELGRVAQAFNRLVAREEQRERELNDTETALRSSNDMLAELTRKSEHRFRDFVAFASDWYWEMDADLRFSYFSDRFTEVSGVEKSALLGKTRLESGIPNVDPAAWEEHLRNLAQHRPFRDFEHPRTKADGRTVWLSISGTPAFDDDGTFTGYRGTGTDVTQRVLAEKLQKEKTVAEQIARTKDEFLANMSHEIRTPINGVLGMAELLYKTRLDATQQRFASTILRSGHALLRVINDILDFSKLEAGKMTLQSGPFCLRELVEDVGELFAESAHGKGLELLTFLPPEVPTALWGDGGRLRQVLTNLVGNAIKFTERGDVMVHVTLVGAEDRDCTLRFEVRDTGIGIDAAQQAHIFESFAQADGSTSRQFGGTGLGLSISAQLCRLMGGDIRVTSAPGAGSTFWFTVRLKQDTSQPESAAEGREALDGVRVLVADDHPTNREILELQLCDWGVRCDCASGGAEALDLLGRAADGGEPYQAVILDMHMAGMDGAELASRINGDDRFTGLPRIMLSSVGHTLDQGRLADAGVRAQLLKPVRQMELHRCLVSVIRGEAAVHDRTGIFTAVTFPVAAGAGTGARVLVVEDNLVNQEVASTFLERAGARVTLADHGAAAVALYENGAFDLVLMDCQMPGMNGFDCTRAIRRIESAGARPRVPIVALTANALSGDRERCLEAGMDDYMSKPFTEVQINATLTRWLGRGEGGTAGPDGPSAAGKGDAGLLDARMLDSYRGAGARSGLLERIVAAYLGQSAEHMAQLREAVAAGDAPAAQAAAHTLKSSSAQIGATALAKHCEALEHLARAGERSALEAALTAVEADYPKVCAALGMETGRVAA